MKPKQYLILEEQTGYLDGLYFDATLAKQSLGYFDRCRSKYHHVLVRVYGEFEIPDHLYLATAPAGWTSPPSRTKALIWLRRELRDGPRSVDELQQEASRAGFSWDVVQLVRVTAGVSVRRKQWYLKERS